MSLLAPILAHRDVLEMCKTLLESMLLPSKLDLQVHVIDIARESSTGYVPDLMSIFGYLLSITIFPPTPYGFHAPPTEHRIGDQVLEPSIHQYSRTPTLTRK
jgi:hypothetical protein